MNKFKISKWIRASEKGGGRPREGLEAASKHVGHREHRYWGRTPR